MCSRPRRLLRPHRDVAGQQRAACVAMIAARVQQCPPEGAPMMPQESCMRIGMVLANHPFPPDIRVAKEAAALAAGGHEALLVCRARPGETPVEDVDGVTAVRHTVHPGLSLIHISE